MLNTCSCGRKMSKYANRCRRCEAAANQKRVTEAVAIVAKGICPVCTAPLRRNLALTGWFQCSQYGADTHRADPSKPPCSFQTFTV